MSLGSNFDINR